MVQGTAPCIDLYPLDQWQKFEERLAKLNSFVTKEATFIRMMMQHATDETMDAQSRIIIPHHLMDYAKIQNEVVILGALKKIEIWNPQVYDDYLNQVPETFEEIAAIVMAQE
jgi:MraZ protein